MKRNAWRALTLALLAASGGTAVAVDYPLVGDVIGELGSVVTERTDTIADLAKANSQGYNEMRLANPDVDPWLTGDGTQVVIPSQYILPKAPREGIVINIPEMRLFHYLPAAKGGSRSVATYPISIGRQDWITPHGATKVIGKVKDPSWTPPESIRREHAKEGDILPAVVGPGPRNPLGAYALQLGFEGYLIHGTDKPFGIGMRVTHGCMRLYPDDIAKVFKTVPVGTQVRLVNQPLKVGVIDGRVMLEAHPPLEEDSVKVAAQQFSSVMELLLPYNERYELSLDWQALRRAVYRKDGVPVEVGRAVERSAAGAARTAMLP